RSRRLSDAMRKLLYSDMRIIDIAFDSGFESQESFTRAFKKVFDITPNEFRKLGEKNRFPEKIVFDADYLHHLDKNIQLQPEIVRQDDRLMVGMKTLFYGVDSEKNNFADKLPALWDEFLPRMDEIQARMNNKAFGIIQTQKDTDSLEYYAACEVTEKNGIQLPEGMVSLKIPSTSYAVFAHKGNLNHINNTVNYIYSSWLLQSEYWHTYGPDIEVYDDQFIPGSEGSIMYYSIPVKV
ncbi:MAG: effector binding domain-containing protein, partial [Gammaproteobacteria bacterium]|nr:effector binding domain-containing protein [Gammaproteobacteria bacterium]